MIKNIDSFLPPRLNRFGLSTLYQAGGIIIIQIRIMGNCPRHGNKLFDLVSNTDTG